MITSSYNQYNTAETCIDIDRNNYSNMSEYESKEHNETRIIPEFTSKEATSPLRLPTKGGVFFNSLPRSTDHKDQGWFTYSKVPHSERVIQTFPSAHNNEAHERATPNRLGAILQE